MAVANGSTLSTTGEMQVTCNVPYVLSVDGVVWVPTASAGGVDTYLLSTGGVVRIFINGTRYFYFVNNVVPQFRQDLVEIYFREGETNISTANTTDGSYYQGTMPSNTDNVRMFLNINHVMPSMTREELLALGATCVQGQVVSSAPEWSEINVEIYLSDFDKTSYNAVFLGNVLLAFFEPTE